MFAPNKSFDLLLEILGAHFMFLNLCNPAFSFQA